MKIPLRCIVYFGAGGLVASAVAQSQIPAADAPRDRQKADAPMKHVDPDQHLRQSGQFFRSDDLIGADVKNPQGEELGEIDQLVLNPTTGQMFAAIGISQGRHALVPLQVLSVKPDPGLFRSAEVTLNRTKAQLEAGPNVAGNEWSNLSNPGFTHRIYSYYDLRSPGLGVGGDGGEKMGGKSAGEARSGDKQQARPLAPGT